MASLVMLFCLGTLAFADEKDFVQLDQNKDGVWSRRECDGSAAAVQRFLSTDHDGDLRVTAAEFGQKDATNKNTVWQAFQRLDANKDSVIDKAEYTPPKADKAAQAAAESELARFDRDENGMLDIAEFVETPKSGLSTDLRFRWFDANEDGRLELGELQSIYGPKYRQYARVEFWAVNSVGAKDISLEQYKKREAKPTRTYHDEFWVRDANDDGALQLPEFAVWDLDSPKPTTKQLFLTFDADADEKLTVEEFAAVPGVRPDNERTVPDPILVERDRFLATLQKLLASADKNNDGDWSTDEWPKPEQLSPLLTDAVTEFKVWDFDANGSVTPQEIQRGANTAFGVVDPYEGRWPCRFPDGRVFYGLHWQTNDPNRDGKLSRDEFLPRFTAKLEDSTKRFEEADADKDGVLTPAEVFPSRLFIQDAPADFLRFDSNRNGRIEQDELTKNVESWRKRHADNLLPQFDLNGDGILSLGEFRQTPLANAVHSWTVPTDRNGNGKLEFNELFVDRTHYGQLWLYGLTQFFFERFDQDRNGTLEFSEYPFQFNVATANAEMLFQLRDKNGDRKIDWQEFTIGEPAERHSALKQLFVVFDADADQSLTLAEFRALPGYVRPELRIVPDPVREERDKFLASLKETLSKADQNQDHQWSPKEWPESKVLTPIVGDASAVAFPIWDFDGNGSVTEEEIQRGADFNYGLIDPFEGRWPWRFADGVIFNATHWVGLDKNRDRKLSREEFLVRYPTNPADGEKQFIQIDGDKDGVLSATEVFSGRWLVADSAGEFLRFDADRDGRVSQAELSANIESWRKRLESFLLPQFDLDGDGQLSLREYRQSLLGDRTLDWLAALTDANGDGRVAFSEFFPTRTAQNPLWMLRQARYVFDRLDRNHDGQIDQSEFPFQINLAVASAKTIFQHRDKNGDGKISWEEFTVGQPAERHPALKQLFAVFDTDGDQQFTLAEFVATPGSVRPELRAVPDPILTERDTLLISLNEVLAKSDQNNDGKWSVAEWPKANVLLPTLNDAAIAEHPAWDFDSDGSVTAEELQRGVDCAYGVVDPLEGKYPWRFSDARVFAVAAWQGLDKNRDRQVTRDEFITNYYTKPDESLKRFQQIDRNQDGIATLDELFTSPFFIQDTVGTFLNFDADQNGRLTEEELRAKIEDWRKPLADRVFPQFDLDNDGQLTLAEYRRTPLGNPVFNWTGAVSDVDGNGRVTFAEFFPERTTQGPLWLARLAKLMFERLDRDRNGSLDTSELSFRFNPAVARAEVVFHHRDKNSDNKIDWSELSANESESRHPALRQLLAVFDVDADQQLSLNEFKALPGYFRPDARVVPDPLLTERNRLLAELKPILRRSDADQDGKWTRGEWPKQRELLPVLRDPAVTEYQVWDFDGDGSITQTEIERGADTAFGLVDPVEGKWPFHHPDGRVFNGVHWITNDPNRDRQVSREEFMKSFSTNKEASTKLFDELDVDKDGIATASEVFSGRVFFADVTGEFLAFDVDKDGQITSDELSGKIESWRKRLANHVFPQFDQNGDGKLTLAEYRTLPLGNPVYSWAGNTSDLNGDAKLEFSEFFAERTTFGPLWLNQVARYYFDRFDTNHDGVLDDSEFEFIGATDLKLSEEGWGKDPVRERYEQLAAKAPDWLTLADNDKNGKLTAGEWPVKEVLNELGAGPLAQFSAWDANSDGSVTSDELRLTLRFAFGLSSRVWPDGWLRWGNGHLISMAEFQRVDADQNGRLSKKEFVERYGGKPEDREKWFPEIDTNKNGELTLQELLASRRLFFSPWDAFQRLDKDKDRFISQAELTQNTPAWEKLTAAKSFPAFDADNDGKLSMAEYRWTPLANPFMSWTIKPIDKDFDGYLSVTELILAPQSESPVWLALFCKELFQRWDRDHDGKLSLAEYDFTVDMARLKPEIAFQLRDKNNDRTLTTEELFSDPKPDPKNSAAVMAYHKRKMRADEAFLAADKNSDRKLDGEEYARYETHLTGPSVVAKKANSTPPVTVPKAGQSWKWSWDEALAYGFTGLNLVLLVVGGAYWMRKRSKT